MVAMLAIGITLGVCLGATLWEVIFCDPLRRQNDELRLQMVRKDLRRAADRFGYVDYRIQHLGTPYIEGRRVDTADHSKAAELRVVS